MTAISKAARLGALEDALVMLAGSVKRRQRAVDTHLAQPSQASADYVAFVTERSEKDFAVVRRCRQRLLLSDKELLKDCLLSFGLID